MNIAAAKDKNNSCLLDTDRLRSSKIIVIGAGGLGSNILVHLAGAGVGVIGICDFDTVGDGNMNRQFLYTPADIGTPKVQCAEKFLSAYAPDCEIRTFPKKLTEQNSQSIIGGFDLAVLACDNNATRLAANAACVALKIPFVDSGIEENCGRAYLYIPGESACLNCLIDKKSESADKRTLSACAGIVGGYAAMLALGKVSGVNNEDAGKIILIDTAHGDAEKLAVKKYKDCRICGGEADGK